MDSFESQLARLRSRYPGASATAIKHGHLIVIPQMPTIGNWSTRAIEVRFVALPYSGWPTNFWAYPDIHVAGSGWPHHSFGGIGKWWVPDETDEPFPNGETGRSSPMPGCPGFHGRWFQLRPQSWNPNRDSLFTFAKMIEMRLQDDRTDREFNERAERTTHAGI
jgi:hypothetical protein